LENTEILEKWLNNKTGDLDLTSFFFLFYIFKKIHLNIFYNMKPKTFSTFSHFRKFSHFLPFSKYPPPAFSSSRRHCEREREKERSSRVEDIPLDAWT
jgi:hypothetical protein